MIFLEFGFLAHQTRLNGYFILSAYVGLQVSKTKNEMFGTTGGVALMTFALLFCLFCYIPNAVTHSTVTPDKVGMKYDRLFHLKCF